MNHIHSVVDDVEAGFRRPVQTSVLARWERKEREAAVQEQQKSALNNISTNTSARCTPKKKMSVSSRGTPRTGGKSKTPYSCRFIPHRDAMSQDAELHSAMLASEQTSENDAPTGCGNSAAQQSEFKSRLAETLFSTESLNTKVLAFKHKAPKPTHSHTDNMRVLYSQNKQPTRVHRKLRSLPQMPERILDAPEIIDDFYLNVMDWTSAGSGHNKLAIALGPALYIWDGDTGDIDLLTDLAETPAGAESGVQITSVRWMEDATHVALGTSDNSVLMWNVEHKKQVRCMKGHTGRVGALAWNRYILSSGSRDSNIFNHDVRQREHKVGVLSAHTQEVCGLEWSLDGKQLASGANDNVCCIWDVNSQNGLTGNIDKPLFSFNQSQAAVKALAWCPFQENLLATGGGTADRHIRFYNTLTGSMVNSIDTESQVCSLVWSRHQKELLSGHGFSQNQLTVWKYPSLVKVGELNGHTSRVLQCCVSADGCTVVSGAADESLRFWKVWEPVQAKSKAVGARRSRARNSSSLRRAIR